MRAFLGIEVSGGQHLSAISGELSAIATNVRIVPTRKLHLTLRFLGEIDESQCDRLRSRLAPAVSSIRAFTMSVAGLGCFPNCRQPRVLWAGIEPNDELERLAAAIDELCRAAEFEGDTQPFKPHITLARIDSRRRRLSAGSMRTLQALIQNYSETAFFEQFVAHATLFLSKRTSTGVEYQSVATAPLKSP